MRTIAPSSLRGLRGPNNEGILALVVIALVVVLGIVSPSFLTAGSLFALLRSSIVPLIFALGVLLVIISGGIDVSFGAIAIVAAYTSIQVATGSTVDMGLIVVVLIAIGIGGGLGLVNGLVIARFRLPTLIVTLGTQGMFRGILLAYIGSRYIADLPASVAAVSTGTVFTVDGASLHVLVVPVLLFVLLTAWILRRTMFGRGVYAIGGDTEAARRAGFPVVRYQVLLYVGVGALAAVGGIFHVILNRNANPQDLVGGELDIIAAVVLGGASIFGGRGSVLGTVLGVLLIQLINTSLLLLGIPTAWQRAAVGFLLLAGVGIQAASARRAPKKVLKLTREED